MSNVLPAAVLFDLDGTLADTAPDLLSALSALRQRLRLPAIDLSPLSQLASRGALAILDAGLSELAPEERQAHRSRYLEAYRAACWVKSRPFDGIPEVLLMLEQRGVPWGVVTNKMQWLAEPLLKQAGWGIRSACLVAGDTTSRPKPAPDPVLAACERIQVDPPSVVFVGDDERDVAAGRDAGTRTIAAQWGYIPDPETIANWGADAIAAQPHDLPRLLGFSEGFSS